jgi:hypothetical protein
MCGQIYPQILRTSIYANSSNIHRLSQYTILIGPKINPSLATNDQDLELS